MLPWKVVTQFSPPPPRGDAALVAVDSLDVSLPIPNIDHSHMPGEWIWP